MDKESNKEPGFLVSLAAGGFAGTVVDVALFPLDTIKTRLQSPQGFRAAGGFHHIYKGLGPAAISAAPTASIFFASYNSAKRVLIPYNSYLNCSVIYVGCAAFGEFCSTVFKVPFEVVKQRLQADTSREISARKIIINIYSNDGLKGFYRGFNSTFLREIPFASVQYPLWEHLKNGMRNYLNRELRLFESSLCGALAGGVSAAITTPMDVTKTRIMLTQKTEKQEKLDLRIVTVLRKVYSEQGITGLYSGVIPRTLWITIGGAIFFGAYEFSTDILIAYE